VLEVLDAAAGRRWYRSALAALEATRAEINSLNVFPVADADTGTNLLMTLRGAAEPVLVRGAADGAWAGQSGDLAQDVAAMARRSLLGARGSSGVILSQLLRGIAEVLAAQTRPADGAALTAGFERAVVLAYAAVAQPVEGTMLTVAREAAEAARTASSDQLAVAVGAAAKAARDALTRTPSQLDVLGRAGVVDAGGRGLVVLLDVLEAVVAERTVVLPQRRLASPRTDLNEQSDGPSPAYEVMYLINTDDARVPALRAALDEIGDSVVVSGGDGLWNVHLHTNDAPAAVELGAAAGRPYDVRVTEIGQGRTPDSLADSADHLSADHFSADHLSAGRVIAVVLAPNSAALPICDLLTRSGAYIVEASELVQLGASELVVLVEDAGLVDGATASDDGTRTELVRRAAEATGVPAAAIGIAAPVQFLSAVAVHDPHRSIAEDAAAMGAAAVSTRYAVVGPGLDDALVTDSVAEISQLLVGGGDLVTVVCAEEVGARIAEDLAAVRPDLDVNHLSVETLPSLVWLGVE
jgi:DAK2 domain fusion protein YloV